MTSNLVVYRSKPVAVNHPRVAACLWFSACGGLAVGAWFAMAIVFGAITHAGAVSLEGAPFFQFAAIIAAGGALLPGALFGAALFDRRRVTTRGKAMARGAGIALLSHLVAGIGIGVCLGASSLFTAIVFSLLATFFGLVLFGWTSLPVGAAGGWLVWKWAQAHSGPRGCRIHGYRELEVEAA